MNAPDPGRLPSRPSWDVLRAWIRSRPVRARLPTRSDPMLRNGHALIVSASVTQIIGAGYWVVAARSFPAAVVGRNSAAISMSLFLAGVAELNLMSTLIRFLPTAGARTGRLILAAYAASAGVAVVLGVAFLLLVPLIEPQLAFLRAGPLIGLWFVVSVVTGAVFVLQDSALTGVRAASFVPVENTAFSLLKLALMFPLVGMDPAAGLYVSWTAATAVAVIPTNAYLFGHAIPRHARRRPSDDPPARLKDICTFLVPDGLAALFLLASTTLLPLLVINRLGAAAAGHYALAWVIGYSLYLISLNMGSSLVVETAAAGSEIRERCLRSIRHLAKLLVPAVALMVAAAPYALGVFGRGYARSDVGVLRLLALSALPALMTQIAISVARSRRRMRVVVGIQFSICALVWVCSAILMGPLGIAGVGAAWLIAQTATAAVLIAWHRLWLPAGGTAPLQVGGGSGRTGRERWEETV